MKIVIRDMPGTNDAVVLESVTAVLIAALDGESNAAAPSIAYGTRAQVAELAVAVLQSIRLKLGASTFEAIILVARRPMPHTEDITSQVVTRKREGDRSDV